MFQALALRQREIVFREKQLDYYYPYWQLTPTFLIMSIWYLYSAYAAHYVYFTFV